MNGIVSFRLCKLSDEELLQKVDKQTDRIFDIQRVPSRNVPADPNEDYDLLVGELLLRFKERLSPPPVSAEEVIHLFLYDNISPDFIPIKNLEEAKKYVEANYTEDDGIHPDFHSFPIYKKVGSVDADINGEDICTFITVSSLHSPAERIEGDAVDCVYEIDFGGNLKCRMKIVGNKINVEAAMNGWGDGISIDEIKITELKTPHHE